MQNHINSLKLSDNVKKIIFPVLNKCNINYINDIKENFDVLDTHHINNIINTNYNKLKPEQFTSKEEIFSHINNLHDILNTVDNSILELEVLFNSDTNRGDILNKLYLEHQKSFFKKIFIGKQFLE